MPESRTAVAGQQIAYILLDKYLEDPDFTLDPDDIEVLLTQNGLVDNVPATKEDIANSDALKEYGTKAGQQILKVTDVGLDLIKKMEPDAKS